MTIQDILDLKLCRELTISDPDRKVSKVFCCDLLSIAMSKAPADGIWVTVMGNKNTLAVATLTDIACIILAEGVTFDDADIAKAADEGITVLSTDMPIFDMALAVHDAVSL